MQEQLLQLRQLLLVYTPNAETIKAIEDVEKNIGLSPKFKSVKDAVNSMLEE